MRAESQDADQKNAAEGQGGSRAESPELGLIEERLRGVRSVIGDLGHELDSYKTKTAAAMGGGVFLLFLAAGAGYDVAFENSDLYAYVGVPVEMLPWIAAGLAIAGLLLLALAGARQRLRDGDLESRLAELEQEYADLLDRRDEISRLHQS